MNRGGSFNNAASNARSANRNNNTPENRNNNLGLRPSKATQRPIARVPPARSTRVAQPCIPRRRRAIAGGRIQARDLRPGAWCLSGRRGDTHESRLEPAAQIAGWRLKKHRYTFPIEQKLFDLYVKATGQVDPGAKDYVPAVDA